MKPRSIIAALLSALVPGLGQIYCGQGNKGAVILAAAIVIGSLNIIFLLAFQAAEPDPSIAWAYWISRLGHDLIALWSLVFWVWAVLDAYRLGAGDH